MIVSEMSRAVKRKHVLNESYQDYFSPPQSNQEIVRIVASRGNNLHEVETAKKINYLASMPTKFRKNIWVKRGDYVIIEPIEEGDKVKGEMVRVLAKEHIKYFKKIGVWPQGFCKEEEEQESDDDMPRNRNGEDHWEDIDSDSELGSDESTSVNSD